MAEGPITPNPKVIAILDIDSFECQIWQRMQPTRELWGRPCVVIDQTGRITSATYEAKALGISRDIRIGDARRLARQAKADLKVFEKPNDREKPDCKETRYASWEIMDALKEYCNLHGHSIILEYASSDEFYLDITEESQFQIRNLPMSKLVVESQTYLENDCDKIEGDDLKTRISYFYDDDMGGSNDELCQQQLLTERALVYGGLIMQEVRNFVFKKTKFVASAGVGSNKTTAKLALALNRPNGITVLPLTGLQRIGKTLPLDKIRGLGSKFGSQLKEMFQITTIDELAHIDLEQLEEIFGQEKALEAFLKSRGIHEEPVKTKYFYEEVNCGKNFVGQIKSDETFYYHLHCLADELLDRLVEERTRHMRAPSYIKVQITYQVKPEEATQLTQPPETDENNNVDRTWSSTINRVGRQTAQTICDNIFWDVSELLKNIAEVSISRICLSAKGFNFIQGHSQPSSSRSQMH